MSISVEGIINQNKLREVTSSESITNVKNAVIQMLEQGECSLKSMNELKEWSSAGQIVDNIRTLNEFLFQVIYAVEIVMKEIDANKGIFSSRDKLDVAVATVDDMLKLPWYLEPCDGLVLEMMISSVVNIINDTYGEDWSIQAMLDYLDKGRGMLEKVESGVDFVDNVVN
jgi:hypothetical protein